MPLMTLPFSWAKKDWAIQLLIPFNIRRELGLLQSWARPCQVPPAASSEWKKPVKAGLLGSGPGPRALCTAMVMIRVRSHITAAVTMSRNRLHLFLMSVGSRPLLLAIDAGAMGLVQESTWVLASLACSSATRVT